jgi:hypothetical protein
MLDDMEMTIIHELVHLKLTALPDSEASRGSEEQAVNGFSEALFALEHQKAITQSVISMACFGNAFHKISITAKALLGNRNHLSAMAPSRTSDLCREKALMSNLAAACFALVSVSTVSDIL